MLAQAPPGRLKESYLLAVSRFENMKRPIDLMRSNDAGYKSGGSDAGIGMLLGVSVETVFQV